MSRKPLTEPLDICQPKDKGEADLRRLLFLRHGDAATPLLHYPDHDTMPLSTLGVEQARRAASALERVGIERIVASPFRRAIQTAENIGEVTGLPVEIDERLRERTIKPFYGVSYEEIAHQYGLWTRTALETGQSHLVHVDGLEDESLSECLGRVAAFARDVAGGTRRTTLAVAHGGPHEWLLAVLLGIRPTIRWFPLGKCRLSVFDLRANTAELACILGLNLAAEDYGCPR